MFRRKIHINMPFFIIITIQPPGSPRTPRMTPLGSKPYISNPSKVLDRPKRMGRRGGGVNRGEKGHPDG